jgi:hypothetical protein
MSDEQVVVRNYAGELFVYPQVRPKKERRPRTLGYSMAAR